MAGRIRGRAGRMAGVVLGVAAALAPASALSQTVTRERDVTITGPRGRSIERKFESQVGPGGISRDMKITRPGGTFERNVQVSRPPFVGGGGGFRPGPLPRGGFGPGPGFIERDVIINRGGGGNALGAGLVGAAIGTGAGLLIGSALNRPQPPPPPVYYAPPAVIVPVQPLPPVVEYVAPVPYQPMVVAPPQTVVVDPVAQAIARLQSHHESSRRDTAGVLGRLRDARAVMPLVERLKNDPSRDVRIACATALGQIGDPSAIVYLERSVVYDKRQDVRDASAAALSRIPRVEQVSVSAPEGETIRESRATTVDGPGFHRVDRVPPPPSPANGRYPN